MLEIKFDPKTEGFSGHLAVLVPSYIEKLRMMKQIGIKVNKEGQVDMANFNDLDVIEKAEIVLINVIPLIKSVDLKYGEHEIKDVKSLEHYDECLPVLMEVFSFVCQGLSLGKS